MCFLIKKLVQFTRYIIEKYDIRDIDTLGRYHRMQRILKYFEAKEGGE